MDCKREAVPKGTPGQAPSAWVVRFAPLVRSGGAVLDVACGSGRHMRLFLARGHEVVGIDRDTRGVRDLQGVAGATVIEVDLETGEPDVLRRILVPDRRFAAVVVTNYLWRPLFNEFVTFLEPGGLMLYETFARGNDRFGRPSDPAFLLRSGELLERTAGRLQVVAYEHGIVSLPRAAVVQRIAAVADLQPGDGLDGDPEPVALPGP